MQGKVAEQFDLESKDGNASRSAVEGWISLAQAAQGTPYSQEYLSLLARKGRLEAIKRGRVWLTTHQAVVDYQRSVEETPS